MYDCNFIMLFLVLLQKQTFLHQSTHQPIYIPISITTVTLPVTCHIGLREATFSHENMAVSIRKKYHKTRGALGSDKKLA